MKRIEVLVATALLALAGCSSATTSPTPSVSPSTSATVSPSASVSPSSSPSPSATPSPSQSPTVAVDVAGAVRVARTLFVKMPNELGNPAAGYFWSAVPWTTAGGPLAPEVKARLAHLNSLGYFDDRNCGESYINGTQYGLLAEPTVVAARANPNGTVTVVLARVKNPPPKNLTVTLTKRGGGWLVTDLASGTGANASIFSTRPNC